MDVLDNARKLGDSITNSKEYVELRMAEFAFHNDSEAKDLLDKLNLKLKLYNDTSKTSDNKAIQELVSEIKVLRNTVNGNTVINKLYDAQKDYDKLISNVNNIIGYMTGDAKKDNSNCKKNCEGCCK